MRNKDSGFSGSNRKLKPATRKNLRPPTSISSSFPFNIRCWTFDLPAMPLGGLGRMSWCLGPVTMIMPPLFVMHGRRVFDVHSNLLTFQPLTSILYPIF